MLFEGTSKSKLNFVIIGYGNTEQTQKQEI